jgi:hypothetical protein
VWGELTEFAQIEAKNYFVERTFSGKKAEFFTFGHVAQRAAELVLSG